MKPNLLFINSITLYGGGEVWMLTVMKELAKRDYKVTLICKSKAEIIKYANKDGIDVLPIRIAGDFDPLTISKIAGIYQKRKIDIVIANVGKDIRLAGLAAKFISSVSVIALHQVDREIKNNLSYRITYNSLADLIVVNSVATKNTLLKSAPWLVGEKINVVYHGIDYQKYSQTNTTDLKSQLGLAQDNLVIGFVGRLNVQKGIKYLLDGFKLIAEISRNVHLVIAGTGELEGMIKEFVSKFNLENRIHLLGFRKDIQDLMKTFDIFLLPSLWEGFGIVLIEAMAAGNPIVATNTSSIPEIVEDGRNGILVPPENAEAICDVLVKLISEPELRIKFGKEGQKIVREKFTIERMINDYENIFDEITETKKKINIS
jgi:glycosyltransferase involved in cell wall biosynthesis